MKKKLSLLITFLPVHPKLILHEIHTYHELQLVSLVHHHCQFVIHVNAHGKLLILFVDLLLLCRQMIQSSEGKATEGPLFRSYSPGTLLQTPTEIANQSTILTSQTIKENQLDTHYKAKVYCNQPYIPHRMPVDDKISLYCHSLVASDHSPSTVIATTLTSNINCRSGTNPPLLVTSKHSARVTFLNLPQENLPVLN